MNLKLNSTPLGVLTDDSDGLAKSRVGALLYAYLSDFIIYTVTMTYFVGLMLEMGAGDAYISAVTVVITACGFVQFVAPLLLEKMRKRKRFLITMRAVYHFLYIVVIGIIPLMNFSRLVMLSAFMSAVVLGNIINSLSAPGISVWHIQNIPERKRSDFFTLSNVGIKILNALTGFLAGVLIDTFKENSISAFDVSPTMLAFLIIRALALIAAVLEIASLAVIKEHPYADGLAEKEKTSLKMLFLPVKNRAFMRVIVINIAYLFISAMIGKYFQIYLLDVVQMSYTYISLSSVIGLPIVLLMTPVWSYLLKKLSWSRVMMIALVGTAAGYFFNTLITAQTQIFHVFCCVLYSSFSVAISIIFAYLPYVCMPSANRTAYMSFFTIAGSVAGLLGNLFGILFMNLAGGLEFYMFGLKITAYQALNLVQTLSFLCLAGYTAFMSLREVESSQEKE